MNTFTIQLLAALLTLGTLLICRKVTNKTKPDSLHTGLQQADAIAAEHSGDYCYSLKTVRG